MSEYAIDALIDVPFAGSLIRKIMISSYRHRMERSIADNIEARLILLKAEQGLFPPYVALSPKEYEGLIAKTKSSEREAARMMEKIFEARRENCWYGRYSLAGSTGRFSRWRFVDYDVDNEGSTSSKMNGFVSRVLKTYAERMTQGRISSSPTHYMETIKLVLCPEAYEIYRKDSFLRDSGRFITIEETMNKILVPDRQLTIAE